MRDQEQLNNSSLLVDSSSMCSSNTARTEHSVDCLIEGSTQFKYCDKRPGSTLFRGHGPHHLTLPACQ